jgi:hypothetical protein
MSLYTIGEILSEIILFICYDYSMNSLIFVYNAESGITNALLDTGHRIFKPSDYPCALCMVTYGPFGMKSDWKKFIATLPFRITFLHRNELPTNLKNELKDFPCLVLQTKDSTNVLIKGEEFRKIKNLKTLKQKVSAVLNEHQPILQ